MELWNCDNGCDFKGGAGDFFQMASPDGGSHLMLVCGNCVYDRYLEDWTVELEADPRYTVYSMEDIDGSSISILNGVITKGKQYH